MTSTRAVHGLVLLTALAGMTAAGDWPMWRYGSQRGATSPDDLSDELHLHWHKQFAPPQTAWPTTQGKLQFDNCYEPVVAGGRVFVPSMIHDSVTAYDSDTGKELWCFYANGPVRFAPACFQDSVLLVSDDGYLYCLSAVDGQLRWKIRGGPSDRMVLGNGRLISTWPARGAPVVKDGVVYFAAGVWPFMGTFVHAVNAETGEIIWTNSGSGSNYLVQPHGSPAFAGVSPQGYLAVTKDTLIVPGGRGVPAGYDRKTGKFLFCHVGGFSKQAGGYDVMTGGDWLCCRGVLCCGYAGTESARQNIVASSDRLLLTQAGGTLSRFAGNPTSTVSEKRDRRGRRKTIREFAFDAKWQGRLPDGPSQIKIVAGNTAYATDGGSRVFAITIPSDKDEVSEVTWEGQVNGRIANVLAADDRLFVITQEGGLFCFGEENRKVSLPDDAPTVGNSLTLIPRGALWRYLDDGSDQDVAWRAPNFDDKAWNSGRAELGYGDGDERTKLRFGDNPRSKHITTYFRRAFTVPKNGVFDKLTISAKVDDGAVFYLNGQQAARHQMPGGAVTFRTLAENARDEKSFQKLSVDASLLQPGDNVLAVEVHQTAPSSSDISFDLELTVAIQSQQDIVGPASPRPSNTAVGAVLKESADPAGYCLAIGANGEFLHELAHLSSFHVIALENDAAKAIALRQTLRKQGLLGGRVAVLEGDLTTLELPPYFCNLIICPKTSFAEKVVDDPEQATRLFRALRPYGGMAAICCPQDSADRLSQILREAELPGANQRHKGEFTYLTRSGPLPNSAPWTHQGASVANTMMSADQRVKAPLGLLWFGGPSHEGVLPRHGHGPTPQVVGGRLFIEGRDFIRAVDVYTGRLHWQRALPGVGLYYDNTGHHPGAGAIGGNYVSVKDGIYVAYGRECLRLDPATGKTTASFKLPGREDEPPFWGYIGVYEDLLIAGAAPTLPWTKSHGVDAGELASRFAEGSAQLVVMDRQSGKVLWQRKAEFNFRHNAICAGGGKVFCIDRMTELRLALLRRRGITPKGEPTLYALDAKTGDIVWKTSKDVFGTWLSYSAAHKMLIQATANYRDRARDEPGSGLAAYRAGDGKVVWQSNEGYGGPVLITADRIITQGTAYNLLTGEEATRDDPLTGHAQPWRFTRNYGCNTAIGCPNLLTFRSAAAGFFDLAGDGGTGNLGGFRSSCTSNLVPADGVLNAPDYTRTCTCSYQLQCSLAFVHMPEAEVWTFQPMAWDGKRVNRVGVNFGAPGDRRAKSGTLWLDYPSVGGRSPDLPIEVTGENVTYFRQHSSSVGPHELGWVAASGVMGAKTITIKLAADEDKPESYTVRLVWHSPPDVRTGPASTKFDVVLQGKTVARGLNLAELRKRDNDLVMTSFTGIPIAQQLEISLVPTNDTETTALSGIEIIRQQE